ncbi:hypothetical protein CAQU_04550 [Corynebacterium aquilae DSM 44791]|uniref:DUF6542 domain-containing protein n=1 Tax=Corynebacterium aquilae DSM 44791 TaxID=1431546 RepID=A0A1L7CF46_9CORY|nr:hypothetical protein CAQU_04550 [Corynebacterium aquilae DSM 44791]
MPARRGFGLPTWSVTSIQAAALMTGLVFSVVTKELSVGYLVAFALGALATTLLVEARGLFVTVAQIPLLFAVFTPVAGWFVQDVTSPEGAPKDFSTTGLLAAVFPVATFFPVLAAVTVGCAVLALLRYFSARRKDERAAAAALKARRQMSSSDRANVETTTRVRARTRRALEDPKEQVTVEELLKKRGTPTRRRRSSTAGTASSAASSSRVPGARPQGQRRAVDADAAAAGGEYAYRRVPPPQASPAARVSRDQVSRPVDGQRRVMRPNPGAAGQERRPRPSSAGTGARQPRPVDGASRQVVRPPAPDTIRRHPSDRPEFDGKRRVIPRAERSVPRVQQPPQAPPIKRNRFLDDDLFDS